MARPSGRGSAPGGPAPNHVPETGGAAGAHQCGCLFPMISDFTAQPEESLYFKKQILTQAGFGSKEFMGRTQETLVKPG